MYDQYTIYGPYQRDDSRSVVILYDSENGTRRTLSYPRYLVEKDLGRRLLETEHVHHKDGVPSNNELDNLQVIDASDHLSMHATKYPESKIVVCFVCENSFEVSRTQMSNKARNIRAKGTTEKWLCSPSCRGKFVHM